jgi:phosphoglycerate kinase
MSKLLLPELPVHHKKVLMRVDFNVPLSKEGAITDDSRIVASLPSIRYVLEQGGALILLSHLGRPQGKKTPEFSLAPCAKHLSELLGKPVLMAPDCVGSAVEKMAKELKNGQILMLENLRFYPAEEKPELDPSFAKQLASLGDVFVNDAFGTAHRAHSSTTTIASYFPKSSAAGFLMQREIEFLGEALLHPKRPFYAIIGGAKISSKLGVLKALAKQVDALFIGGGMAYTFFKARGISIGNSICEDDLLTTTREITDICAGRGIPLLLPRDIVATTEFKNEASSLTIPIDSQKLQQGIPQGYQGMDIGPQTIKEWQKLFENTATIFWNGPLGVFEFPNFAKGTNAIARAVAQCNALSIVGGGDSIAAINAAGVADHIDHISTGGGAALEYIEFGKLPGIEALTDASVHLK